MSPCICPIGSSGGGRCSAPGRRPSGRASMSEPVTILAVVPSRPLVVLAPTTWFELNPGDRILVGAGEPVTAGLGLAERRRDPGVEVGPPTLPDPGDAAAG